jgi:hypothetical protein
MRSLRYLLLIVAVTLVSFALVRLIGILAYGVLAGAVTLCVGYWVAG